MTDSINGWTPPVVYDFMSGRSQSRIVTQEDVDRWNEQISALVTAYGLIKGAMAQATEILDRLQGTNT